MGVPSPRQKRCVTAPIVAVAESGAFTTPANGYGPSGFVYFGKRHFPGLLSKTGFDHNQRNQPSTRLNGLATIKFSIDTLVWYLYSYRTMKTRIVGKPTKADLKAQIAWAEEELKETLAHAESLKEYIVATRKLAGKKTQDYEQQAPPGVSVIRRRRTKGSELANQTAALLVAAGSSMHVRDIVTRLSESGNPVVAKNPINTVAVALARREDVFKKVGPNTFDLVNRVATNTA